MTPVLPERPAPGTPGPVRSAEIASDGRPRASRRSALLRLGAFAAAAALAALLAFRVPLPGFSLCGMKIFTGLPCPGCGMTRSIVHLCRGDLAASLRFHPLGIVLAAALAAAVVGALLGLLRGRDPVWAFAERRATLLAAGFGAALVAVWLVRAFVVPEWAPDPVGRPAWLASASR